MGFNDINLQVSGPQQPASIYKTKVLKGQVPFAIQVTEPNTKYVIKHNFDLGGESVTIPEGCLLEFDGGAISNGTLVGQSTILIYSQPLDDILTATLEGSWRHESGVKADEEDITDLNGELKFKDKAYIPANYSGLGRKILRKNIVNGVNTLTQSMINEANTIYIIQYDFTLGEDITIPENCILEFDGGSISGEHTITGQNTDIEAGLVKIFGTDVTLTGSWNVTEAYPEWFGAKGDGVTDDTAAIKNLLKINSPNVLFSQKIYKLTDIIDIENTNWKGNNTKIQVDINSNTISREHIILLKSNTYINNIIFEQIITPSYASGHQFIGVKGSISDYTKNVYIDNCEINIVGSHGGTILDGNFDLYSCWENVHITNTKIINNLQPHEGQGGISGGGFMIREFLTGENFIGSKGFYMDNCYLYRRKSTDEILWLAGIVDDVHIHNCVFEDSNDDRTDHCITLCITGNMEFNNNIVSLSCNYIFNFVPDVTLTDPFDDSQIVICHNIIENRYGSGLIYNTSKYKAYFYNNTFYTGNNDTTHLFMSVLTKFYNNVIYFNTPTINYHYIFYVCDNIDNNIVMVNGNSSGIFCDCNFVTNNNIKLKNNVDNILITNYCKFFKNNIFDGENLVIQSVSKQILILQNKDNYIIGNTFKFNNSSNKLFFWANSSISVIFKDNFINITGFRAGESGTIYSSGNYDSTLQEVTVKRT